MPDPAIDKQLLYGDFRDAEKRRSDLAMRAAHKALDIADDDMKIEANRTETHNGMGTKGVILTALAAGLPSVGLMGLLLARPLAAPALPATTPTAETKTADPPTPPIARPVHDQEYDAVTEVRQPDGTWREVKRERLKTRKE